MMVSTAAYRPPVSRDALQFRRGTQVKQQRITAENTRRASALAHLDIERDTLFDQRTFQEMTSIETWFSDPEAQVMRSDAAILDLSPVDDKQELSPHQKYLIGSVIQSLAHRRISTLETAVDADRSVLIDQLSKLHFESIQHGSCWRKELKAGS